jgi:hypothetical protein
VIFFAVLSLGFLVGRTIQLEIGERVYFRALEGGTRKKPGSWFGPSFNVVWS